MNSSSFLQNILCVLTLAQAMHSPCAGQRDSSPSDPMSALATSLAPTAVDGGLWNPGDPLTVIDVMVLYSNNALLAEGSESSLQSGILEAIDFTNYCLTNSLIGIRLNLVFAGHLNYTDSGSLVGDLSFMSSDARVAALRNDYKADLVFLLVEAENYAFAGLLSGLPPPAGNPNFAFCALRRKYLSTSVFANEIGNLLGAQHDRENAFDANLRPVPGTFPYSYAHRLKVDGITYITLDAIMPGVVLPYFSNPRLAFEGVPLGVPAGEPLQADNAQTLNRMGSCEVGSALRSCEVPV
jgi:hypothetical protein